MGPEVAAVATLAGFAPDPEQRMLLDAAFALDRHGKSVAFTVAVIAPRQNLKTGFEKQYALGQLFVRDERLVVWSAHEFDTAQEALRDLEALFESSSALSRRVKKVVHGAVPEIWTTTGARLKVKTRTSGGGRGLSGRKIILDEAYALQPGQVGALMPVMLAQPDPQVLYGSSACRPESAVLWDLVLRGRAGGDPRMIYAEWCMPPPEDACAKGLRCDHARGAAGCGCDDPVMIRQAHSAITRGRILIQTVMDLRADMPPAEYGREVCGWHDEVLVGGQPGVDPERWRDQTDAKSSAETVVAFGVETSWDRSMSAVGVAALRPDGKAHVECIRHERGTAWVVDYCKELAEKTPGIVFCIDTGGPAKGFIEPLRHAGIEVYGLTTAEATSACAWMADAVDDGLVWHGPQPELDDAVGAAKRRAVGDGPFVFGRLVSGSDISPLQAVTWAAHILPSVMPIDNVSVTFI